MYANKPPHYLKSIARSLILPSLLILALFAASCKRAQPPADSGEGAPLADAPSSVPPFSTKEPERYQAVRFYSITMTDEALTERTSTLIARDGERRREDYQTEFGTVSYLQLPEGTFIVLREKKLYAESTPDGGAGSPINSVAPAGQLATDTLPNFSRPTAYFERLGAETVNGRAATKYRVKSSNGANADESLIWVDEALGMPIKTEITAKDGTIMIDELRDIRDRVDSSVFELPTDFKRVTLRELYK